MNLRPWISVPILLGLAGAAVYVPEIEEAKDFIAYREASVLLFGDGDPYATGYIYPPTFAFLFRPLAALPPLPSAIIWYALNVALLAASLRIAARIAGLTGPWAVLPLLLTFRFANNTLRSGQTNILILFLVSLAGLLAMRRRDLWAGLLLALAASIKVNPGLLVVAHALRRRWKVVGAAGAGAILFLSLPVVGVGPRRLTGLLADWQAFAFAPYLSPGSRTPFEDPETGYIPGHSVRATTHRLLRPIDASPHDDRIVRVNLVELSRGEAETAALAITSILLGLFVWSLAGVGRDLSSDPAVDRPGPPDREGAPRAGRRDRFSIEYALAILFIFVLSPYVRKGHGTLLLIPFAVAVAEWRDPGRSGRFRAWTAVAIVAAFVLGSLSGRFTLGVETAAITESISALLWGNLILLVWGIVAVRTWCGAGSGPQDGGGVSNPSPPAGDARRR